MIEFVRGCFQDCRAKTYGVRGRRALPALALMALLTVPGTATARSGPQSLAPLADKLTDAVVNISTSQKAKGPSGVPLPSVPKGSPFEEFFEDFFNRKDRGSGDRKVSSLGSGFVIDGKEGLIVTNHHVIEGADEIVVNFHDGTKLKVDKVIGRDTKTDLALLKVTPKKPLAEVRFGGSEAMKVGDWVMAIGNPFGLGGSVSVGIISAKQRDINSGPYDDYLQTDAAINKGNSGGPLFNMDGEVIGVNTAIISPSGGSIGIGFAVPSDTAMSVVDQLRQFGETRRGWLGVNIQSVTEEIADSLGVKENSGALVSAVTSDSPAAKAGIVAGDVIVRLDGREVSSVRSLPRLVSRVPVGKTIDVELVRKGERKVVKVVVGRLEEAEKSKTGAAASTAPGSTFLGMTLAPIDDAVRKKLGIDARVKKGVAVVEVGPQSAAGRKGIKVGDVIVEAAQDPVASVADVEKAIEKIRKDGRRAILLRVEDAKGQMRFVAVPVTGN
ncbi:MAG: Do family serine endopeptidase [Hyphomicrobiaceae bacterium]